MNSSSRSASYRAKTISQHVFKEISNEKQNKTKQNISLHCLVQIAALSRDQEN